jgi:hypothetical protein
MKAGQEVTLTAGWARGKKGIVIKCFKESRFGSMWHMVQVVVSDNNKPFVTNVPINSVK